MAPFLTRGRVCNLLLLLGLASAVPLGYQFHGTEDYILFSDFFRLPQAWGGGERERERELGWT
jgi:hypothetical protein